MSLLNANTRAQYLAAGGQYKCSAWGAHSIRKWIFNIGWLETYNFRGVPQVFLFPTNALIKTRHQITPLNVPVLAQDLIDISIYQGTSRNSQGTSRNSFKFIKERPETRLYFSLNLILKLELSSEYKSQEKGEGPPAEIISILQFFFELQNVNYLANQYNSFHVVSIINIVRLQYFLPA